MLHVVPVIWCSWERAVGGWTIKALAPWWNWLFVLLYLGLSGPDGGQPEGEWIERFGGKET